MSDGISFSLKLPTTPIAASPEHLQIVEAAHPDFLPLWKQFLNFLPMYSYRYQPSVMEYYKMLSSPSHKDLSFIVKNADFPIIFCPLILETIDGKTQGSYVNGFYLPMPLLHPQLGPKQLRALETFICDEVTKRLKTHGASRWLVEAGPFSAGTDTLEDLLPTRIGALDTSVQSHVIDLTCTDDELWLQLRHSAKSLINKGLKTYEFLVYDQSNFTPEIGDRHRLLHHKCAGRVTRPLETFYKMYSWISEGHGLMFEQKYQGKTVQMIEVALGKNTAYGASAADDPEFTWEVPLTHCMNYFIYKEVQKRGIQYYDVGETTYRDFLFSMRTQKEKSICDFKRGFGKQTIPWKRWIWFDSVQEELAYLEEQFLKYKKHIINL